MDNSIGVLNRWLSNMAISLDWRLQKGASSIEYVLLCSLITFSSVGVITSLEEQAEIRLAPLLAASTFDYAAINPQLSCGNPALCETNPTTGEGGGTGGISPADGSPPTH